MSKQLTRRERNAKFNALSPKAKRKAIARDVLEQLKAKAYLATPGTYFRLDDALSTDESLGLGVSSSELQEKLNGGERCSVCAVGAAFASRSRLGNRVSYDKGIHDSLLGAFSKQQIDMLESAFEQTAMITYYSVDHDDIDRAVRFGCRFRNDTNRMRAIFQNVLDNDGEFVP